MPFGGIPHHSILLLGKPRAFLMDSSAPEQSVCRARNWQMGWRYWGRDLAVGNGEKKGSRECYVHVQGSDEEARGIPGCLNLLSIVGIN